MKTSGTWDFTDFTFALAYNDVTVQADYDQTDLSVAECMFDFNNDRADSCYQRSVGELHTIVGSAMAEEFRGVIQCAPSPTSLPG